MSVATRGCRRPTDWLPSPACPPHRGGRCYVAADALRLGAPRFFAEAREWLSPPPVPQTNNYITFLIKSQGVDAI